MIAFLLSLTWTSYTNRNGVLDICPASDTLYLATTGGLVVYWPGHGVIAEHTNIQGLPGVVLSGVALDGEARPWVLCMGEGIAYWDGTEFQRYPLYSLPISNPDNIRYANGIWARGKWVYVATNEGLLVLDTKGTSDTLDDGRRLLSFFDKDTIYTLYFYKDSVIAGGKGGAWATDTASILNESSWDQIYPYRPVFAVLVSDTSVYLGTDKGLRRLNDLLIGEAIRVIRIAEHEGRIYFNTYNKGVWRYIPNPEMNQFSEDTLCPITDTTKRIFMCPRGLYAGPAGIWVGFGWPYIDDLAPQLFTGGFAKYEEGKWKFRGFGDIGFGVVGAMARTPDGAIWIGTTQPGQYPVSCMRFKDGVWDTLWAIRHITSFKVTRGGRLFAGSWGQGVYEVDTAGNVIRQYDESEGLSPPHVVSLGTDLAGNIIVGVMGNVCAFRIRDTLVENFQGLYLDNTPNVVEMAPDGSLWIGTSSGIYIFSESGGSWHQTGTITGGLPSQNITFLERHKDKMYVGTAGGLAIWREGSMKTCLAGKNINCVEHEANGRMWVWTAEGLYRTDSLGGVLESYTPGSSLLVGDGEGLGDYPIADAMVLAPEADQLWVGTDKGVSVLCGIGASEGWVKGLYLYPNPLHLNHGKYRFYIPDALLGSSVWVYTVDSKQVTSAVLGPERAVDLPKSIAPGLYLVLVKNGDESVVLKLVVM
ncbi:MAG: hypothetical protein ABIM19_04325 [candidate division WOR-3 bacterium]